MITRRGFLKGLGAGIIGVSQSLFPSWMPRLVFSPPHQQANRDILVVVFQRGGMDGLNAVIPFGEGKGYFDRRPTLAIPEPGSADKSGIDIDGFFGFHPVLASMKEVYDDGRLAVIHAAGLPLKTRSHFGAMAHMEKGTSGSGGVSTGWVNRYLQATASQQDSPMRAVGMGSMLQTSLLGQASVVTLESIANFHLKGAPNHLNALRQKLSAIYTTDDVVGERAGEVFAIIDLLKKTNPSSYPPSNGAVYPLTPFGMGMKQVAQLIKAGVGLEVACVDIGGWDTHAYQGGVQGNFATYLSDFGNGMSAFYTDLHDYMNNITVVTMSEFGRRVEENFSAGTDHGRGNCMFIMGGGATSGVYTNWPTLAEEALDDGDLAVTMDYRDVLSEILTKRLNVADAQPLFPGYTSSQYNLIAAR